MSNKKSATVTTEQRIAEAEARVIAVKLSKLDEICAMVGVPSGRATAAIDAIAALIAENAALKAPKRSTRSGVTRTSGDDPSWLFEVGAVVSHRMRDGHVENLTVTEIDNQIKYVLDDGTVCGSPSGAALKVNGGTAVNGKTFWKRAGSVEAMETDDGDLTGAAVEEVEWVPAEEEVAV